ncbi:MAG: hypothetical protein QOE45_1075 [Frankiaceae bacterium]|jgi:hypothetical protein|nr:hypothetical protein [Frankiaceae bacterium]
MSVPRAVRVPAAATFVALALGSALILAAPGAFAAPNPVLLRTADSFAILAGTGITYTGANTIKGDVGSFPTLTQSGPGTLVITGANHHGDTVTMGAKDDLVTAYDDAADRLPHTPTAVELGGTTKFAGVYSGGTFGITGTLTLDAQGDPDAQFVFQSAATVIAEAGSRVALLNGANPCNVVWQVTSSATFKTGSRFVGDVIALTSITAQTGATFRGRLLARNGAVTLDTNTIDNATCVTVVATASATPSARATASATPTSGTGGGPSATPSPVVALVAGPGQPGQPGRPGQPVVPLGGPPRRTVDTPPAQRTRLPVTGARTAWLLATGLGMLALGVLSLGAARRRGLHAV